MTIQSIRKALRNAFGARHYRITKGGEIYETEDGQIHIARGGEIQVRGVRPNSGTFGWYVYGNVDDADTEARINTL